jgi:hypothetical protein
MPFSWFFERKATLYWATLVTTLPATRRRLASWSMSPPSRYLGGRCRKCIEILRTSQRIGRERERGWLEQYVKAWQEDGSIDRRKEGLAALTRFPWLAAQNEQQYIVARPLLGSDLITVIIECRR